MKRLFNPDSTLVMFIERMVDLVLLSILWCLCCLPIVTIVSSTTALYYVTLKIVENKETKIIRDFFKALKEKLTQKIPLTLVFIVLFTLLYADFIMVFSTTGIFRIVLFVLFTVVFFLCFSTMCYTYALQARFSNTIFNTIKNAFLLSLQNITKTVLIVLLHLLPVVLIYVPIDALFRLLPFIIAYVPSCIAYFCSIMYSKIFSQLLTEV